MTMRSGGGVGVGDGVGVGGLAEDGAAGDELEPQAAASSAPTRSAVCQRRPVTVPETAFRER
jgi:hypothetical protein